MSLLRSLDGLGYRDGIFNACEDGPAARRDSWASSLMQSALFARIYETTWRPTIIRAFSTLTYETEDAIVDRYVDAGKHIRLLDLCCGTARASRRWVNRGAEALAVDVSTPMLHEARRRCADSRLVLLRSDAGSPVARRSTFDGAFCLAALHLLPCPDAVIAAAATALRPGGLFFAWVATSTGIARGARVSRMLERFGVSVWPPLSLSARIREQRFEVLESITLGAIEFVVGQREQVCVDSHEHERMDTRPRRG